MCSVTNKSRFWLLRSIAKIIMGATFAIAIFGSLLTACNAIGVLVELIAYYLSFFLILISGCVLVVTGEPHTHSRLKAAATVFCLLFVAIAADCYSNESFLFWKLRLIRQTEWKRMGQALTKLGSADEIVGGHLTYRDLDASLKRLGVASDFCGGQAGSEVNPIAIFGVKSRRWGLVVGRKSLEYGQRAEFKRVQAANDVWFFVGDDS